MSPRSPGGAWGTESAANSPKHWGPACRLGGSARSWRGVGTARAAWEGLTVASVGPLGSVASECGVAPGAGWVTVGTQRPHENEVALAGGLTSLEHRPEHLKVLPWVRALTWASGLSPGWGACGRQPISLSL